MADAELSYISLRCLPACDHMKLVVWIFLPSFLDMWLFIDSHLWLSDREGMALSEMFMSLASNPYFSAGFGLFGVGSAAAVGRAVAKVSVSAFRRKYITTLQVTCSWVKRWRIFTRFQVPCNDKAYTWLLSWISREAAAKSQHLSLRSGGVWLVSNLASVSWLDGQHYTPRRPMTGQSGRRRREGWWAPGTWSSPARVPTSSSGGGTGSGSTGSGSSSRSKGYWINHKDASCFFLGGRDWRRSLGDRHPDRPGQEEGASPQDGWGGQKGRDSDRLKCCLI